MSEADAHASEQALFAAREFLARYVRETGQEPPASFAYEMGYLRGRIDGALAASKMFDEISRVREQAKKGSDDDTK
jgi:hypothetical protein